MTSHPLTNFEIQKHFQNGSRINGYYSRDNLPKRIKDETNVINLDEYANVGTYWIAFDCKILELFILTVLELHMFLK